MQDDYLSRYDKIQKLNGLPSPKEDKDPIQWVMVIIAVIGIAGLIASHNYEITHKPKAPDCSQCHNRKTQMVGYFKQAGNPTPEEMAVAVLATRSPRLMAAIAVKGEKNTHYKTRAGGYKRQHAGAWQMNRRLHRKAYGAVPHDAVGQALQAERYLTDLTQEMPIRKALSQYGGDSTDAYQKRVLAELVKVP